MIYPRCYFALGHRNRVTENACGRGGEFCVNSLSCQKTDETGGWNGVFVPMPDVKKSRQRFLGPSLVWSIMGPPYPGFLLVPTWRIIPANKWLVTSIYQPFRPFVRAFLDLLRGLTNMEFHLLHFETFLHQRCLLCHLHLSILHTTDHPRNPFSSGWVVFSMIYRVGNIPGGYLEDHPI